MNMVTINLPELKSMTAGIKLDFGDEWTDFRDIPQGSHFEDKGGRRFIKVAFILPSSLKQILYREVEGHRLPFNAIDYDGVPGNCPDWLPFKIIPMPLDNSAPAVTVKPVIDDGQQQKPNNMNMKLEEAVLVAVKELKGRGKFSAYDVTTFIRKEANDGKFELPGLEAKSNGQGIKYWVNHNDVRSLVDELLNRGELKNLGLINVDFNGTFRVFEFDNSIQAQAQSLFSPGTANPPALTFAPNSLAASMASPSVKAPPAVSPSTLVGRVDNYLKRHLFENPTLKQVQSAVKVNGITCEQFKDIVKNLGYRLTADGTHKSDCYSYWKVG